MSPNEASKKRHMKIVHVIDYYQPKLGYQEAYLAKNHAKAGHEVHVVTSDRYASGLYPMAQEVLGPRLIGKGSTVEEEIYVHRLPIYFELQGRLWMRGFKSCLLKINPDLVIVHGVLSVASIQAANMKKSGMPFKLVIDDHMVPSASRPIAGFAYRFFSWIFGSNIRKYTDSFVSTHEASDDFMTSRYGIQREHITFIPLGCDADLFKRDESVRSRLRLQLDLKDDDVLFVYAGKLVPSKGPHLLVKAAIALSEQFENVRVLLLGTGAPEYASKIRRIINHSGMSDNFILRNLVPNYELPAFYSAADVGVWPMQCSLTMIEAMACQLPIIIADNSGTPDRVRHENGFIYNNGNVASLCEQMRKLMDSDLRAKMGLNARVYAEQHDWKLLAQKFIEL